MRRDRYQRGVLLSTRPHVRGYTQISYRRGIKATLVVIAITGCLPVGGSLPWETSTTTDSATDTPTSTTLPDTSSTGTTAATETTSGSDTRGACGDGVVAGDEACDPEAQKMRPCADSPELQGKEVCGNATCVDCQWDTSQCRVWDDPSRDRRLRYEIHEDVDDLLCESLRDEGGLKSFPLPIRVPRSEAKTLLQIEDPANPTITFGRGDGLLRPFELETSFAYSEPVEDKDPYLIAWVGTDVDPPDVCTTREPGDLANPDNSLYVYFYNGRIPAGEEAFSKPEPERVWGDAEYFGVWHLDEPRVQPEQDIILRDSLGVHDLFTMGAYDGVEVDDYVLAFLPKHDGEDPCDTISHCKGVGVGPAMVVESQATLPDIRSLPDATISMWVRDEYDIGLLATGHKGEGSPYTEEASLPLIRLQSGDGEEWSDRNVELGLFGLVSVKDNLKLDLKAHAGVALSPATEGAEFIPSPNAKHREIDGIRWTQITWRRSDTRDAKETWTLLIDGESLGSISRPLPEAPEEPQHLVLGGRSQHTALKHTVVQNYRYLIDEVRISARSESDAWVRASYLTRLRHCDPAAEQGCGRQELLGESPADEKIYRDRAKPPIITRGNIELLDDFCK